MPFAKPFDPKRNFGTVYGDNRFSYEQDGQLYDGQRRPVDPSGNLMDVMPEPAERNVPASAPSASIPSGEDVDLRAWADGAIVLPWNTVTAAIASQLGAVARNKVDAIALINDKIPA